MQCLLWFILGLAAGGIIFLFMAKKKKAFYKEEKPAENKEKSIKNREVQYQNLISYDGTSRGQQKIL